MTDVLQRLYAFNCKRYLPLYQEYLLGVMGTHQENLILSIKLSCILNRKLSIPS